MMIRPIELAAKALCDVKTSRRWLQPNERKKMKPATAERLRRAAVELGWDEQAEPKAA
jgi:glycine/D-amino acid oxidase-like deaminating enzyme